ncbi:uncharacterized protein DUF2325 [Neorhizobium alkalisoli]|uniref:Uncharacterized protein DUF2325 n=1 Tax=Neorhizobium alkalisoli TaxID=528178 RepID=A0A561QWA0_9HYPH|nr:uncharacterized protein DUF2325 [Neorhizobium alkalisoli]
MAILPGLHQHECAFGEHRGFRADSLLPRPAVVETRPEIRAAGRTQRLKIWELSSHFHCSIIGTCLTAGELRHLLVKAGDAEARAASDHVLHGRGVQLAGHRDIGGKLLNKALDRRHEAAIRRAAKIENAQDLRLYWREAFDRGEIAGAYWAVQTHPAADSALIRDVFGEVHMLSHLVGSASRLDIARLAALEKELEARDDKMAQQQRRLDEAAAEQNALRQEIATLQTELMRERVLRESRAGDGKVAGRNASVLEERLSDEQAWSGLLVEKLARSREAERVAGEKADFGEQRVVALQRENELLEAILSGEGQAHQASVGRLLTDGGSDIAILYVGGRRGVYERMRSLAAESGFRLEIHDGGMEDSTTLLPAAVQQADLVLFPVDHISHTATGIIKRLCRESGKTYIPLRSAGLASFLTAIADPVSAATETAAPKSAERASV